MKLEMIKIGRIVNAHGIHGEVRVQPRDADPYLLTEFKTFYIDGKPFTPTANHVHKSLVLMKFPGVDDMNTALTYKDKDLFIRRDDAELPEGECFDEAWQDWYQTGHEFAVRDREFLSRGLDRILNFVLIYVRKG